MPDPSAYPNPKDKFNARILDVVKRLGTLERRFLKILPGKWTEITYLNGWERYEAAEGTWIRGEYRKGWGNSTEMRGLIKRPAGDTALPFTTLPLERRPPHAILMTGMGGGGAVRVDVAVNGNVWVAGGSGAAGFLSLWQLSFSQQPVGT